MFKRLSSYFLFFILLSGCAQIKGLFEEPNKVIILATTTSTYDSGLLDALIPTFEDQTDYSVKIIAVGTGQALQMGTDGNADVLLVHAPASERVLIENGSAINRVLVMHNDFVIVGPASDPSGIKGMSLPEEALAQIANTGSLFASRGDDSGTNKKELALWKKSGVNPAGDWYLETGQGMGATLRVATEKVAYTLTDRGTYLSLKDTLELEILVEGAPELLNIYHIMQVNPDKWPLVNDKGGKALVDFFLQADTQKVIEVFGVDKFGQPLFFPDGGKTEADMGINN